MLHISGISDPYSVCVSIDFRHFRHIVSTPSGKPLFILAPHPFASPVKLTLIHKAAGCMHCLTSEVILKLRSLQGRPIKR
jgi:hypothetical protein